MASRWRARFAEANFWLARFLEPRCIVRIQRDRYPESGQTPARDGTARIHVVVPVHATLTTLREALWFEMNPRSCPVKCSPYGMFTPLNLKTIQLGRSLFHWGGAYLTGVRDQRPFLGSISTFFDTNTGRETASPFSFEARGYSHRNPGIPDSSGHPG